MICVLPSHIPRNFYLRKKKSSEDQRLAAMGIRRYPLIGMKRNIFLQFLFLIIFYRSNKGTVSYNFVFNLIGAFMPYILHFNQTVITLISYGAFMS